MTLGPEPYICPACGSSRMRPDKTRGRYLVICARCESIVDQWTQYGGRSGNAEVIRLGYERLLAEGYEPSDTTWKVFTVVATTSMPSVRAVGREVGLSVSPAYRQLKRLRDELGLVKLAPRGWGWVLA